MKKVIFRKFEIVPLLRHCGGGGVRDLNFLFLADLFGKKSLMESEL